MAEAGNETAVGNESARAHVSACNGSSEWQQLVEDAFRCAASLWPAQRRQAGHDVVVGVGETRGDDHGSKGRRVKIRGPHRAPTGD